MSDPRICIIGAGNLASRKIYPFIGLAGGRIVGVCDLDQEKAERNRGRFGGSVYSDFEKMLSVERPDGVIACIGPEAHARIATRVLELGFPVYTEKPPASSAASALEVARIARNTGHLCMTAFKKRYASAYQYARKWLEAHEGLERYSISVDYASGAYSNDIETRPFLLDFAIHLIDLVPFLFGDPKRVFSFACGDRAYAVSLEFANGAVGSMNLTDGRSFQIPTEEVEITLEGGNFMTIHNSSGIRITEQNQPCGWREPPLFTSAGDSGDETGHGAELRVFMDCLKNPDRRPASEIYEAYKSMVLFEAIARSVKEDAVVEVNYQPI